MSGRSRQWRKTKKYRFFYDGFFKCWNSSLHIATNANSTAACWDPAGFGAEFGEYEFARQRRDHVVSSLPNYVN